MQVLTCFSKESSLLLLTCLAVCNLTHENQSREQGTISSIDHLDNASIGYERADSETINDYVASDRGGCLVLIEIMIRLVLI